MGPPGSGKSTLGRALSRHLGWPLVDKDDVRDLLDDAVPQAGGLAYAIMFNVARRQLVQGLSVICDSPFAYRRCYERAQEIVQEAQAALAIVECRCSDEAVWRRRVEARQALALPAHHTTDWAAVQAFQQRTAADAGYPINHPHLVVDTLTPLPELCTQVVAWLQNV
jgi:predicted kinase